MAANFLKFNSKFKKTRFPKVSRTFERLIVQQFAQILYTNFGEFMGILVQAHKAVYGSANHLLITCARAKAQHFLPTKYNYLKTIPHQFPNNCKILDFPL